MAGGRLSEFLGNRASDGIEDDEALLWYRERVNLVRLAPETARPPRVGPNNLSPVAPLRDCIDHTS